MFFFFSFFPLNETDIGLERSKWLLLMMIIITIIIIITVLSII